MNLKQLIKEAYLKFDDCDCGKTIAPLINESKKHEAPISEALRYHVENKLPITENVFRAGSLSHITLLLETRQLFDKGIIILNGKDKWLFENTDLGKYDKFEGKMVPLDLPLIMEGETGEINIGDTIKINPKSFPNFEFPYGVEGEVTDINKADYASDDLVYTVNIKYIDSQGDESDTLYIEDSNQYINEAEKKKTPPIGKPKRGGSKKFYVYVRDKGKIKKVSFGDTTGLSAKINNPEARRAFAKRHDCANKKDRTKASYWSCRLPRYAKLLGLKSSFSGFW